MADKKAKAGIGRGAPLAPGTLNEVGATDDGTWQWADDTAQELQDSTGAEWSLGAPGIHAVRKDVPPSRAAAAAPAAAAPRAVPQCLVTGAPIQRAWHRLLAAGGVRA